MEVSKRALRENAEQISAKLGKVKLCAMVKADAYGHGLIETARAAGDSADWFGVATQGEGVTLRKAGVKQPILLTCGVGDEPGVTVAAKLTATVSTPAEVFALQRAAESASGTAQAHIKLDTGMNRLGAKGDAELISLLSAFAACRRVKCAGVYTHFYSTEQASVERCFSEFTRLSETVRAVYPQVLVHAASSAAFLLGKRYWLDMVRAGILLYGCYPFRANACPVEVEPAAKLSGSVLLVKEVKAGETLSYGGTYAFPAAARVAVVRLGYGDGVPRALSNTGRVWISGRACPIRGSVCMDLLMAEIGNAKVSAGQRAYLFGEGLTAEDAAQDAGTISYEILAGLTARVERRYT